MFKANMHHVYILDVFTFFLEVIFEAANNNTLLKIIIKPLIKFFCTETVCKKEDIQLTLKAASAKCTLQNEEKY